MTTHTLYRFFGSSDELLYVGITNNPARRFSKHKDEKAWWLDVSRIELEQHDSRDELLAAERQAVMDERPLHNKAMNVSGPAPADVPGTDPIVGLFFHSWYYEDGDPIRKPQCQGRVVSAARDGYLLEFFSWWDGYLIDGTEWRPFEEMKEWTFYSSAEEMQIALGCRENFGGTRRFGRQGVCGGPITHVIRDYEDGSPVYRCGDCIKFYGGKVEGI